jgi:hypothetical protein
MEKLPTNFKLHSGAEHVVNLLKAALSTIPFTGFIASLLSDYIPNTKHERLLRFSNDIVDELGKIKDQIDESKINKDELAFIVEKCFQGVAENYQKSKLEAFKAIFINSISNLRSNKDIEIEYYINLTNRLTSLHIEILAFLKSPKDHYESLGLKINNIHPTFLEAFKAAFNVNPEIVYSAFNDLYEYGFINKKAEDFSSGIILAGTLEKKFKFILSQKGESYIRFITI